MMRVSFYGVRGGLASSGKDFSKIGNHTTCFRFDAGGHLIILDGGTGLAPLGRELMHGGGSSQRSALELVMLLTHGHHDHIAGLPHFLPAFSSRAKFHVFGPPAMGVENALKHMFSSPWFPVEFNELQSEWHLHDLGEGEEIELPPRTAGWEPLVSRPTTSRKRKRSSRAVRIRAYRSYAHPRDGVYVYRIDYGGRAVVVATDVEAFVGGDRQLARFARGADLLIHDAQYSESQYYGQPTQGYGHSTPQMAAELAAAAGVERLLLTHHSPEHDDDRVAALVKESRKIFKNTDAAAEGMVVELRSRKAK